MTIPMRGSILHCFPGCLLLLLVLLGQEKAMGVNRLFINNQTVQVGEQGVSIPVRLENEEDRHGFSLSIRYDPAKLELAGVDLSGTAAENAGWNDGTIIPEEGVVVWAVIMGLQQPDLFDPSKILPPGGDLVVAELNFNVLATEATTTTVSLEDGLGLPTLKEPGKNLLTTSGFPVIPDLGPPNPAVITIGSDTGVLFIRGDFNEDTFLDVSDAVAILGWLFIGDEGPNCLDRGDTDDSGEVDISDAIRLLTFLFIGDTEIEPPVEEPGIDPTDDLIPCLP